MGTQAALETVPRVSSYEADKEAAREIQYSLVPSGNLISAGVEVAFRFSPFAEVGGDFTDFFQLPNGLVGLYVGDVVGKGLAAAMYAALVMGTLRGINKTGEDTAAVLTLLNKRLLVRPITGRYCATLYALFDPITRQLTFSNAGLPHPVLVSNGRYSRLGEGGLPSAVFRETSYDKYTVRLAPGDSVLFATDGLHELRNQRDEDFSWDRLGELWCECTRKTADESLDHLFAGAKSFSDGSGPHDDVTAVVLKVPMEPQAVSVKSNPEGVASLDNNLESSSELPVCAAISL